MQITPPPLPPPTSSPARAHGLPLLPPRPPPSTLTPTPNLADLTPPLTSFLLPPLQPPQSRGHGDRAAFPHSLLARETLPRGQPWRPSSSRQPTSMTRPRQGCLGDKEKLLGRSGEDGRPPSLLLPRFGNPPGQWVAAMDPARKVGTSLVVGVWELLWQELCS